MLIPVLIPKASYAPFAASDNMNKRFLFRERENGFAGVYMSSTMSSSEQTNGTSRFQAGLIITS